MYVYTRIYNTYNQLVIIALCTFDQIVFICQVITIRNKLKDVATRYCNSERQKHLKRNV